MGISKTWRIGGFVTALAASGALIASATGATGAYFSDSTAGTITGSTGHLTLAVAGATSMDFSGLVPGQYQTDAVTYTTDSSATANEDIWLVFDPTSQGYLDLTGDDTQGNTGGGTGGLGRYGHFAVADSNGGLAFQSYNLTNATAAQAAATPKQTCDVTADGRGGSAQQATSPSDTPPLCGVPANILLASNLSSGATGTISVTFGVTGKWTAQSVPVASVGYTIVATQHGILPNAGNY